MSPKRATNRAFVLTVVLIVSHACRDVPNVAGPVPRSGLVASAVHVPSRRADTRLPRWTSQVDSILWAAIANSDSLATVGFKLPGTTRGVWQHEWLIPPANIRLNVDALRQRSGIQIVSVSSELPKARIRVTDIADLKWLRALPFIDYVEPAYMKLILSSDPGCTNESYGHTSTVLASGDTIGAPFFSMNIVQAWENWPFARGSGARVAILDTGVWDGTGSAFNPTNFTAGFSADPLRSFHERNTVSGLDP